MTKNMPLWLRALHLLSEYAAMGVDAPERVMLDMYGHDTMRELLRAGEAKQVIVRKQGVFYSITAEGFRALENAKKMKLVSSAPALPKRKRAGLVLLPEKASAEG